MDKAKQECQIHHCRFILAFAVALDESKRLIHLNGDLPKGNVVDSESNSLLLESLCKSAIANLMQSMIWRAIANGQTKWQGVAK